MLGYYLYEVRTFPSRHTFPMLIFYLLLEMQWSEVYKGESCIYFSPFPYCYFCPQKRSSHQPAALRSLEKVLRVCVARVGGVLHEELSLLSPPLINLPLHGGLTWVFFTSFHYQYYWMAGQSGREKVEVKQR